ncbi:MAG: TlpA disulfide reductase family protein [Thermodesulfobacteriota bacterium]
MIRKILFALWFGGIFFLVPIIQEASAEIILNPKPSPPLPSFGIQRLTEKKEAPAFSLKTLSGSQVSLSDFKGKPLILKFWATWCPSCVEELPHMEKFFEGKKDQLQILMPAIDGEKENRIQNVVKKNKVTLPVLLDVREKIARTYKVTFIPVAFLIDREGMIVGMIVGERDWSSPEAWSSIKDIFGLR